MRKFIMSRIIAICSILGCAVLGGAVLAGTVLDAGPAIAAAAPAITVPAPATVAPTAPAPTAPAPAAPSPATTGTVTVITISKVSCASARVCLAYGSQVSSTGVSTWVVLVWDGKTWTQLAVPTPVTGASNVILTGLSCVKGPFCMGVGEYTAPGKGAVTATFAVTWTGGALKLTPALPQPAQVTTISLSAVSCVTARQCVAVGDVFATFNNASALLFETWDGTTWAARTKAVSATSHTQLNDVSCASATRCITIGYLSTIIGPSLIRAFAILWNGSSITGLTVPVPAGTKEPYLSAVSCAPAETSCVATGYDFANLGKNKGLAFTEMMTLTTWKLGKVAWPKGTASSLLLGVSCVSATYCVATGTTGSAVAAVLAYDGTSWSAQPLPVPAKGIMDELDAVSCTAVSTCVAIGNIGPADGVPSNLQSGFLNGPQWTLLTIK